MHDIAAPMKEPPQKKATDSTAALRQQRRRERLKEQQARYVRVVLSREQGDRLDLLVASGYASDQSSAMSRALDAAFEREIGGGNAGKRGPYKKKDSN